LGRLEEVVPLIRDVYELCPANLELALGLSEAYLHIGDRTKARDVLEQVLLFYPDDPLVRKRWAEVAAL
jgi:thioredoxin-like negative regulator of GroEL